MTTFAAIIGGGISGLAVAHGLKARGKEVVVLEAGPRPGGTIHTFREQGFIAEAGPNGFLDKEPATGQLIAALNLTGKVREAQPTSKKRFIFSGGRLQAVPSSPPGFFKTQLLPFRAKLRVLGDLFAERADWGQDESLASFATRRFGPVAARTLIDAVQTGIYAGDFERLSLQATFPRLAEMEMQHRSLILGFIREARRKAERATFSSKEPAPGPGHLCTFEGGLSTLIEALAAELGPALRTGAEVTSVARAGNAWRVESPSGAVEAEQLVLAIPSYAAAPLVRPLDAALADELAAIEHARVAVVHLGFPRSALKAPPEGFGFLAPRQEGRRVLGCIYVSSIFPWRAPEDQVLLTTMVGGATRPELVDLDDGGLEALAREELKAALEIDAEPGYRRVVRWQKGIPQYNVGHLSRLDRILQRAAALPGFHLAGNSFRGVGMNDCIRVAAQLSAELCRTPGAAPQRPQVKVTSRR